MKRHLPTLLIGLSLATTALSARSSPDEARPTRLPVRLVGSPSASRQSWIPANLQSAKRATLATRLSASVREVRVEEGQRVAPGELLVSLADADLRAQLAAAESSLASAASYERRIRALVDERAATPVELEAAAAQRAQAEAAVNSVRTNLEYAEIRAPFAGTIEARRVDPGDLVGPGQPLLVLEGNSLELVATLSEDEAHGVSIGERLRFESSHAEGEVEVTALTPGGDPLSHRRSLRARVLGGRSLRSGAFARLGLPPSPKEAGVWVPRSALVERGDLTGVFVASAGRAELRWVALGEPAGDLIPVTAGLHEGEKVIDAPSALHDGQLIEVMP